MRPFDPEIDPRFLDDPAWASLRRLLWFAFLRVNRRVLDELAGTDHAKLAASQIAVLRNMEHAGINLKTLASRVGVTKQAMTRVVRSLESSGYASVTLDSTDHRAKIVHHTPKSLDFVRCMVAADQMVETCLSGFLGKQELGRLKEALKAIVAEEKAPRGATVLRSGALDAPDSEPRT